MTSARSRLWTLPQLAFAAAFVAIGLGLLLVPRDTIAGWVGAREDEIIGAVRFIGFMTIGGGIALGAPVLLRPHAPTPRAWVADGAALGALALGLFLIGRGHLYVGCIFAALSYVVVAMATCFAIWRPEEIKLHGTLPRGLQARLLRTA